MYESINKEEKTYFIHTCTEQIGQGKPTKYYL